MTTLRWRLYAALSIAAAATSWLAGGGWLLTVLCGLLAPMVVIAGPKFVTAVVTGAATPGERERPENSAMSGTEFEDYVARIARTCGVPVIMTSLSGDWGVDLIVGHRPNRLAVQCKRLSRPVGAGAVQEVVAGAPMQDCTQTMVVTNHEFTPAARKLAERHGCVLVSGAELPRLASTIRRLTQPST
ncbi:restriction endonuclease [Mycolicibacterium parafortuitum]|uniref:Restriction endonuclease n=1 Tax=Mycolicibacterium parafortuitum TaxID=39692 RepID=A0A7I7UF65_MYCPF|nr:restriction endonuclease [Mycolicibacterium parafortuitum]BBY78806.1 restriction endonuclease [Mycolicibacterium parafortuitum]